MTLPGSIGKAPPAESAGGAFIGSCWDLARGGGRSRLLGAVVAGLVGVVRLGHDRRRHQGGRRQNENECSDQALPRSGHESLLQVRKVRKS